MFDLKVPCVTCPFRKENAEHFSLSKTTLDSIRKAPSFQCHKTVDYNHDDEPRGRPGDKPQQCAGLMALLQKKGEPNQIMQVAIRTGVLDTTTLDPEHTTVDTFDTMYTFCKE